MFLSFEQKLIRLPSVYSLTHWLTNLSALYSQNLAKASCRSSKIKFAQILVWISKCCYIFKKLQNSQFHSAKRNSTPRTFRFQFCKKKFRTRNYFPIRSFFPDSHCFFYFEFYFGVKGNFIISHFYSSLQNKLNCISCITRLYQEK